MSEILIIEQIEKVRFITNKGKLMNADFGGDKAKQRRVHGQIAYEDEPQPPLEPTPGITPGPGFTPGRVPKPGPGSLVSSRRRKGNLTADDIDEIKSLKKGGMKPKEIEEKTGIPIATIYKHVRGL